MPLHPEDNSLYWPLLLTDAMYLLPEDLVQHSAAVDTRPDATAAAPAESANTSPSPTAPAATPTATPKIPAQPKAAVQEKPQADLLWGSLQKGVLIMVDYPDHSLLERTDGLFLVDILKAVGFDFKEVATLNVRRCKSEADWQYVRALSCTWVISFGVQQAELPFTLQQPDYQKHNKDGKTILAAESLSQIRTDVSRKKLLWNLLKQAFV